MKVFCKKSCFLFKKNNFYDANIHSVVEIDDYITIWLPIENNQKAGVRFSLRRIATYVEDYVGENEIYFYDYFCYLTEERRKKLNQIQSLFDQSGM